MMLADLTLEQLAAMAQVLGTAVTAAAFGYGVLQLREIRKQVQEDNRMRRLQETQALLAIVGEPEVRSIRRRLLAAADEQEGTTMAPPDHAEILRLSVAYDRIGLMAQAGLVDLPVVSAWQGVEIRRLWDLSADTIERERRIRGRESYCQYFEYLANELAANVGPLAKRPLSS